MRKLRTLPLFLVLVALFLSACTGNAYSSPPSTQQPTPLPTPTVKIGSIGLAMGSSLPVIPPEQMAERLQQVKDFGVKTIRLDADWGKLQPDQYADFRWSVLDRVMDTAHGYNLSVLLILNDAPAWAREGSNVTKPEAFGVFSRAVVERYQDRGLAAVEVWNEANVYWGDWYRPNVRVYAQLLSSAIRHIRTVSLVPILTSGLSPAINELGRIAPGTFLDELFGLVDPGSVSGIAFHPYAIDLLPNKPETWSGFSQLTGNVPLTDNEPSIRKVLEDHRIANSPIYLTEYGVPSEGNGYGNDPVSESNQAQAIYQYLHYNFSPLNVMSRFVYTWVDDSLHGTDAEDHFGLLRYDGTSKPAAGVLKDALAA